MVLFLILEILSTTGGNPTLETCIRSMEQHLPWASIMQPNWSFAGLLEVFILGIYSWVHWLESRGPP